MELMQVRRNLLNTNHPLPPMYQRVEYIKSTGTQYIEITDTFYQNTRFDLVCQSDSTNNTTVIFGYGAGGGYWFGTVGGKYSISNNSWSNVAITDKIRATIQYTNHISVQINGVEYDTGFTGSPRTLTLFSGRGSSSWFNASVKVFGLKADGVVNMIPCYRISDGEIGMFDLVTKTFLTNSGTGTFIKGPDV